VKIRYECEQCGTIYTSEAAALRCEAQDTKYLSGFSSKNVQLHFWLRRTPVDPTCLCSNCFYTVERPVSVEPLRECPECHAPMAGVKTRPYDKRGHQSYDTII